MSSVIPECECCNKPNAYALFDPLNAYVCQDCVLLFPNVKFSSLDSCYRRMVDCSCGKTGIPNDGNFFICDNWSCVSGSRGYLTYGK